MQDVDPDKTRVIRQKRAADAAPAAVDADESTLDKTQMMQPSARARAAAEALQISRNERESNTASGDYQWSGEVDFDVTAEAEPPRAPPRAWPRIAVWVVGAAFLIAAIAWLLY